MIKFFDWGYYSIEDQGVGFFVARILVFPGQRAEFGSLPDVEKKWIGVVGSGVASLYEHDGEKEMFLGTGDLVIVKQGTRHSFNNTTEDVAVLIEVGTNG